MQTRPWIRWLSLLFILPWAVPSIPTILSFRFMLNPEWGVINQIIFKLTADDGPNWLNDPTLALSLAIVVHIWKSLPFWTLILIAGRLAIPGDLYEAASVDGASNLQKFRFITWPSMQTLYLTCTILSMIWTLGDFNSVYLLDRRRAGRSHPCAGDARHPLSAARSGRPVDGGDRLRDAARAAARLLHDEAAVEMSAPPEPSSPRHRRPATRERAFDWHDVATDAKLLLIGIPVFLWTHPADLPPVPVRDLAEGAGILGQALARPTRPCATSRSCSGRSTTS